MYPPAPNIVASTRATAGDLLRWQGTKYAHKAESVTVMRLHIASFDRLSFPLQRSAKNVGRTLTRITSKNRSLAKRHRRQSHSSTIYDPSNVHVT
jgi:hypothetical protein